MTSEASSDLALDTARSSSVVAGALAQLRHVGAKRLAALERAGLQHWDDVLRGAPPAGFPPTLWEHVRREAAAYLALQRAGDLRSLCRGLRTADHWRVLYEHWEEISYFDVETEGLGRDAGITVIVCLHRGRLHRFSRAEGLDGFLTLLDDVRLLVSFNGCGFDIPQVLRWFHIPELPCAHVDLRWVSYHDGCRGGLKRIERALGIERPADLEGVDGDQAVRLWQRWEARQDEVALRLLTRYCSADVVALQLVAARLLAQRGHAVPGVDDLRTWALIPPEPDGTPSVHDLLADDSAPLETARGAALADAEARRRKLAEQWRRLRFERKPAPLD